ncbi:hypothetical protein L798_12832 [Zootermopsis nevadensis]|uniref:Uncharacterized protein n=1 Tax=Zootermopsis nevadensis TaxID=136037 RepID=A0A067RG20_ZOONE|nr:hypothetical protein L798_12832 [Zootermopsis nevadensis]
MSDRRRGKREDRHTKFDWRDSDPHRGKISFCQSGEFTYMQSLNLSDKEADLVFSSSKNVLFFKALLIYIATVILNHVPSQSSSENPRNGKHNKNSPSGVLKERYTICTTSNQNGMQEITTSQQQTRLTIYTRLKHDSRNKGPREIQVFASITKRLILLQR